MTTCSASTCATWCRAPGRPVPRCAALCSGCSASIVPLTCVATGLPGLGGGVGFVLYAPGPGWCRRPASAPALVGLGVVAVVAPDTDQGRAEPHLLRAIVLGLCPWSLGPTFVRGPW